MGNNYVSGVNWSSLKKFAEFCFGEIKNSRVVGKTHYIIYIDKDIYHSKRELIEKFEDKFLINIKPDDV